MKHILRNMLLLVGSLLLVQAVLAGELVTYYHSDLQGTPIAATDARGYIMWRSTTEPYGEKIQLPNDYASSTDNKRGFTSHEQDVETGLVYMQARYYDPVLGRFLSVDPVGFKDDNSQTFNRYAYGNNNPYRYVDPDGRETGSVTARSLNYMNTGRWEPTYCNCSKDMWAFGGLVALPLAMIAGPELILTAALNPATVTEVGTGLLAGNSLGPGGVATIGVGSSALIGSSRGVIREFEQAADQIYYRVFSDGAVGKWLTAVAPRSAAWAREALSLPPGNTASQIQEVLVPAGTLLQRSRASAVPEWGRLRGGAEQFELIDKVPLPPANFGVGQPLK